MNDKMITSRIARSKRSTFLGHLLVVLNLQQVTRAFSTTGIATRLPAYNNLLSYQHVRGTGRYSHPTAGNQLVWTRGKNPLFLSQESESGGDGNDEGNNDDKNKSLSSGRAGGRRRAPKKKNDEKKGVPGWLIGAGIPLLVLWLVVGNLFGGGSDSSFVYYQSSVYESSIMGENGQVERSRKESVRTNVPSLLPERQQGNDRQLLRQSPDPTFERAMDREMRSLFDDFF